MNSSVLQRFSNAVIPDPGPVRVLALSTLARAIGNGALLTLSVLYFTRSVGLPDAQVGLGLTVGAVLGMVASVPAGHLADSTGPRLAATTFVVLQGLAVISYVMVQTFGAFLIAACAVAVFEACATAARGALVAVSVPHQERVRVRAYLRAVTNAGAALGGLLGSVVLASNQTTTYLVVLGICGALFIGGGLIYLAVPDNPMPPRPPSAPRWEVLRDVPYLGFNAVNVVLSMNAGLLTVAIPIWIASRTQAPNWTYGVIIVTNTVLVTLLQVRVSRGSDSVDGGARAMRRAGVVLALSCLVLAFAAVPSAVWAVVVLLVGAVLLTYGELEQSAGGFALSYELAPEHAHGQYQGLFGLSTQLGASITPAVTTLLLIGLGGIGWAVVAGAMVVAGLLSPAVARRAQKRRMELDAEDGYAPA